MIFSLLNVGASNHFLFKLAYTINLNKSLNLYYCLTSEFCNHWM